MKQRILTGLVLVPVAIAVILLSSAPFFAGLTGAIWLLTLWEWTRLIGMRHLLARILVLAAGGLLMGSLWMLQGSVIWWLSIAIGLSWWLLSVLWMRHFSFAASPTPRNVLIKLVAGMLILIPAWVALVQLHGQIHFGPEWTLFALVLVWAADSFAYFVGSRFGRTKLAPRISPGKTREGVWGAMVGTGIVALAGGWWLGERGLPLLLLIALALVCVAFSVIGDLFESLMKRQANVKDSGALFPGHGGLLDRLDGVFAALPMFVAGKTLIDLLFPRMMRLALLGATGSIGASTLDVVARHPQQFRASVLSAHRNVDALVELCRQFRPDLAVISDPAHEADLVRKLRAANVDSRVLAGPEALVEVAGGDHADCVVAAIVGAAGLESTLTAARAGKRLLLANKESVVMAGDLLKAALDEGGGELLPLDSEHNAVFQCLPGGRPNLREAGVCRIILTASGGPFRGYGRPELVGVTPDMACAHPNWAMGRKISVDSATLMNKGLEVIEAHFLFGAAATEIDVVVHPQSIVHSLVEYRDGSVLAQLGNPDMRTAIAYALAWPERIEAGVSALDLIARLDFEAADRGTFRCLDLAYQALAAGGMAPTTLNAANEEAVAAFLAGRLPFLCIEAVIEECLACLPNVPIADLAGLLDSDLTARREAQRVMQAWRHDHRDV